MALGTDTHILTLSDLTVEVEDFVQQFNDYLATRPVWKGELVTQTSQTLVELISSVGTFDQAKLLRVHEDSFTETAQSDDAIRAITVMQGLRMTRMLPAEVPVALTAPFDVTLAPFTQFVAGGVYLFNREEVELVANATTVVPLYEGQVKTVTIQGLGTEFQAYVANESAFVVSDMDTQVRINGVVIPKTWGTMWNYRSAAAYADLTMPDGRLLVQFGNTKFGSLPYETDVVEVTYVVTQGDNANNRVLLGRRVTIDGFANVSGTVQDNPSGGTDVKSPVVYKNVASGSFGTYESGVTKPQYVALVNTYPGIVDAITQAQREINPGALEWMNVIRVSAITNSPWTQNQIRLFIERLQSLTMYSTRFQWQDPLPVDRDIEVEVYAFNTAILTEVRAQAIDAITKLLAPKPGILMTDFFESDLDTAIKAACKGQVSYVKVIQPTSGEMVVTSPLSPNVTFDFIPGGADAPFDAGVYAYSVAVTDAQEAGPPTKWVFPQITGDMDPLSAIRLTWPEIRGAQTYRVYGRIGGVPGQPLGLMATIPAVPGGGMVSFVDDNTITPSGGLPNNMSLAPIRFNRLRSLEVRPYYAQRQQRLDGTPERKIVN